MQSRMEPIQHKTRGKTIPEMGTTICTLAAQTNMPGTTYRQDSFAHEFSLEWNYGGQLNLITVRATDGKSYKADSAPEELSIHYWGEHAKQIAGRISYD